MVGDNCAECKFHTVYRFAAFIDDRRRHRNRLAGDVARFRNTSGDGEWRRATWTAAKVLGEFHFGGNLLGLMIDMQLYIKDRFILK